MTFNYYNFYNILNDMSSSAQECVLNNDRESLKEIIMDNEDIGLAPCHRGINCDQPLIQIALMSDRDDMVMDLYMASPLRIKELIYKANLDNLVVYTDILGNAVINGRYNLVERLLDLEGIYKFHIDGMKNTNRSLLKFSYLVNRHENQSPFEYSRSDKYITSPLMLTLLINDFKMYEILKKRGGFFTMEDSNCQFHFNYCQDEKIKEDITMYFKNEEEII